MAGSPLGENVIAAALADATLMALATGGGYLIGDPAAANQVGQYPARQSEIPNAFTTDADTGAITMRPWFLVSINTASRVVQEGALVYVHFRFYDRIGAATIRSMQRRVMTLFHERFAVVSGKGFEMRHVDDSDFGSDDNMFQDSRIPVSMGLSRYMTHADWSIV